jgi:hypothetical protein
MAVADATFDRESELQAWVYENISDFFGECILLPSFRITTPSGKHGNPDGFAFNFPQRSWWIIECELLSHGVWPHIAEQLTRYVVAGRNNSTLRLVRDKLLEAIVEKGIDRRICTELNTDSTRLLQQIEVFIETVQPSIALFIDDTNQDLTDFCNALDVPTETYRIKKLLVDGSAEYYSPDHNAPALVTSPEESTTTGSMVYDVVEQLGGGELINRKLKCYRLNDGRTVKVQTSKLHERHQAYWYGINPVSYKSAKDIGCSNIVFAMGQDGLVDVPMSTIEKYLKTTYATNNADATVRHYHVHISPPPEVVLKGYGNADDIDVSDRFVPWS